MIIGKVNIAHITVNQHITTCGGFLRKLGTYTQAKQVRVDNIVDAYTVAHGKSTIGNLQVKVTIANGIERGEHICVAQVKGYALCTGNGKVATLNHGHTGVVAGHVVGGKGQIQRGVTCTAYGKSIIHNQGAALYQVNGVEQGGVRAREVYNRAAACTNTEGAYRALGCLNSQSGTVCLGGQATQGTLGEDELTLTGQSRTGPRTGRGSITQLNRLTGIYRQSTGSGILGSQHEFTRTALLQGNSTGNNRVEQGLATVLHLQLTIAVHFLQVYGTGTGYTRTAQYPRIVAASAQCALVPGNIAGKGYGVAYIRAGLSGAECGIFCHGPSTGKGQLLIRRAIQQVTGRVTQHLDIGGQGQPTVIEEEATAIYLNGCGRTTERSLVGKARAVPVICCTGALQHQLTGKAAVVTRYLQATTSTTQCDGTAATHGTGKGHHFLLVLVVEGEVKGCTRSHLHATGKGKLRDGVTGKGAVHIESTLLHIESARIGLGRTELVGYIHGTLTGLLNTGVEDSIHTGIYLIPRSLVPGYGVIGIRHLNLNGALVA